MQRCSNNKGSLPIPTELFDANLIQRKWIINIIIAPEGALSSLTLSLDLSAQGICLLCKNMANSLL